MLETGRVTDQPRCSWFTLIEANDKCDVRSARFPKTKRGGT
jgi:hypothetical protein